MKVEKFTLIEVEIYFAPYRPDDELTLMFFSIHKEIPL